MDSAKPSILIVEDNPDILELTALVFRNGGFKVTTAVDGVEAMEIYSLKPFDVVLSDVQMPRMNGIDLLQAIRKSNSHAIVFLFTGSIGVAQARSAVQMGAMAVLQKPLSGVDLLSRVKAALTSPRDITL